MPTAAAWAICDAFAEVACGVGPAFEFQPIIEPKATVASAITGLCPPLLCSITGEGNVIDDNLGNAARISITLGVEGTGRITVADTDTVYSGTRTAGFVVSDPAGLLSLDLLNATEVALLREGDVVEAGAAGFAYAEIRGYGLDGGWPDVPLPITVFLAIWVAVTVAVMTVWMRAVRRRTSVGLECRFYRRGDVRRRSAIARPGAPGVE